MTETGGRCWAGVRGGGAKFGFLLVGVCSLVACGEDAAPGGGPVGPTGGMGGASTAPQGPLAKPGTAAAPLTPSTLRAGPTTYYDGIKFLFEGATAPQKPVAAGTFPVAQVSVVRGRVLDEAGTPLPGVTVSAVGQPSWGSVTTRADGFYDIAVVGGGALGLRYTLPGALSSQRTTRVAWNRTETMRDVVLLAPSATSTAVTFGNPAWQVAAGDRIVDKSGARRAWIAIPPGTKAKATDEKKLERELLTGTLRLTEYTRGDRGKEAMPGDLPPRSAYTFACSFAFDEAPDDRVTFDKPVYAYVEDFLGFPRGTVVPSGSFAGDQNVWDREASGRVVGVVGTGPSFGLDGTGDGKADDPVSLGLAAGELAAVAGFEIGRAHV